MCKGRADSEKKNTASTILCVRMYLQPFRLVLNTKYLYASWQSHENLHSHAFAKMSYAILNPLRMARMWCLMKGRKLVALLWVQRNYIICWGGDSGTLWIWKALVFFSISWLSYMTHSLCERYTLCIKVLHYFGCIERYRASFALRFRIK